MELFQNDIKSWVVIDNEIKNLNNKLRKLRENRSTLNNQIINYVNRTEADAPIIQISDGYLQFVDRKQTPPLTFKYIEACLTNCIKNSSDVEAIMKYIKESRDVSNIKDIKRTYK